MPVLTKRLPSTATAPSSPTRTDQIRHGDRNMIRCGDDVLFQERKGCQWQTARFQWADHDDGGTYYALIVDGFRWRFVRPEKVRRVIGRKQRGQKGGAQ